MLGFYYVNDGKDVEWGSLQIMRCIHCYISLVNNIIQALKTKKCLITYYKTYGITSLKNMWMQYLS